MSLFDWQPNGIGKGPTAFEAVNATLYSRERPTELGMTGVLKEKQKRGAYYTANEMSMVKEIRQRHMNKDRGTGGGEVPVDCDDSRWTSSQIGHGLTVHTEGW